jgi:glycosyltransferase involved in cell wall biosynthesis
MLFSLQFSLDKKQHTFIKPKIMNDPLVSILICTYNASETIKETIYSCLQQTYKNIELLVHDDKSLDTTRTLISEIKDKRVRFIYS